MVEQAVPAAEDQVAEDSQVIEKEGQKPAGPTLDEIKAENERLKKERSKWNYHAWDQRKAQDREKELLRTIAEQEERLEAMPPGDADITEMRKQIAREKREIAEAKQRMATERAEEELKAHASELARQYDIDMADLANCKTPEQMELMALKKDRERQQARAKTPSKGFDQGGGGGTKTGYKPTIEEFRKTDAAEALKKIESGEWKLK